MMSLREWQAISKPEEEYIYNASEKTGGDLWVPFSIGMSIHFLHMKKALDYAQIGPHDKLVYCAINMETDMRRRGNDLVNRKKIIQTLSYNGINNVYQPPVIYYNELPKYKFVISPEGNGIDCHRHYEALMAGCIPIVEHNPLIEDKYKGCPILYTTDYSEITLEFLEKKYLEMLDTIYDFSCLFLSTHSSEIQTQIKENGNYWGQRCYHAKWYLF